MKEALEAVLGLSGEIVRAAAQATYLTHNFAQDNVLRCEAKF